MKFDEILQEYVGQFGRFQIYMLLFISIEEIFYALHSMTPLFHVLNQEHHCRLPEINSINFTQRELQNLYIPWEPSGKQSSCLRYDWNMTDLKQQLLRSHKNNGTDLKTVLQNISRVKCESWTHNSTIFKNTMTKEWDLVCDRQYLASTVSSLFMTGCLSGTLIFGPLSDWVGRKPVVVGCGIMYVLSGVAMALVPTVSAALAMRFILAFFGTGETSAILVMVTEFVGPDYRVWAATIYYFYWIAGYVVLPGLAYLTQDWRNLQLVISAPLFLFFIAFIFIVPESPRWLLYKNEKQKANAILHKMAKWNRREYPDDIEIEVTKKKIGTMLDLVRTPGLRKVTLILALSWFTNAFVYFGLSLNTSNLHGNPYLNCFIAGVMEIPAYLIIIPLLKRFGRIYTYVAYMLIAGVSLVCIMPVPSALSWLTIVFSMIGKFGITATFQIVIYYSAEVYPTEIRAIGLSYVFMFSKIGASIASYMDLLGEIHSSLQFAVFGALGIVGAILALLLPETRGTLLTQTVSQAEHFIRENPGKLRSCCQQVEQSDPDLPLRYCLNEKPPDKDQENSCEKAC